MGILCGGHLIGTAREERPLNLRVRKVVTLATEWKLDKFKMIVDDVPRTKLDNIQRDDSGTDHTIDVGRRQNHR